MLRWSAQGTGRTVNLAAIVDPAVDLGLEGAAELVAVGAAAVGSAVDPGPVERLARVIGEPAAVRAAAAGAFELYNRVVDAAGLPVGRVARERNADIVVILGLGAMPHAGHGA